MIKHIGRHGDKKVVVIFRQIPGEEHMCLLVYSDLLPRNLHDVLFAAVESNPGQTTTDLADVLHRTMAPTGNTILNQLHTNRLMKKVPSSQVIMTPAPKAEIRLDELNDILAKLAEGGEAAEKLRDLEQRKGMVDPKTAREAKTRKNQPAIVQTKLQASDNAALSDEDIAQGLKSQAENMRKTAENLLTEATRLEAEAEALVPAPKAKTKRSRGKNAVHEAAN